MRLEPRENIIVYRDTHLKAKDLINMRVLLSLKIEQ